MEVISNVNFALSGNNKNQLRESLSDLNEKLTTAINTLDDSALEGNLSKNQEVN